MTHSHSGSAEGSTFSNLRGLLFPDQDLRHWVLEEKSKHRDLQAARELIRRGELEPARLALEPLRGQFGHSLAYWYTVAYLACLRGDREAARTALHQVLLAPEEESRTVLLTWKLLRDLGEQPATSEASRVHGVVVEFSTGSPPHSIVVAAYADGVMRWLCQPGPALLGDNWTESEREDGGQLFDRGQAALSAASPSQQRHLPEAGAAHIYLLTPGATYRAAAPLKEITEQHPLHDLFACAWRLHVRVSWFVGMLSRALPESEQAKALVDAIVRSDALRLKNFLGLGADANTKIGQQSLLAIATSRKEAEIVRLLVSRGAEVNARVTNDEGLREAPILTLAAGNGSGEILTLLLEAGAVTSARDARGGTPLMTAAFLGHPDCVQLLIDHGSPLEAQDDSGYTALMYAANAGHLACVTALFEAGADVHARDEEGNRPLAFAAQHGFREVVDLLLTAGADPAATGSHGMSAIDLAAHRGHREVAGILKQAARAQA